MIELIEAVEAALSKLDQEIAKDASVLVQYAAGDWSALKAAVKAAREAWDKNNVAVPEIHVEPEPVPQPEIPPEPEPVAIEPEPTINIDALPSVSETETLPEENVIPAEPVQGE